MVVALQGASPGECTDREAARAALLVRCQLPLRALPGSLAPFFCLKQADKTSPTLIVAAP